MAQKPTVDVRSTGSQRDNRFLDTFHDQHRNRRFPDGRPWTGWREKPAMQGPNDHPGFTGSDLQPGDHTDPTCGWSAPFMPSVEYFRFDYQRKRITIHYEKLFGHDVQAYDQYYEAAARLATAKEQAAPDYGTIPSGSILSLLGNPPRSPKVAEALMAGDPYLLGFSTEVNEELALALGLTRSGYRLHRERSKWEQSKEAPIVAAVSVTDVLTFTPDRLKELMAGVAAEAAHKAVLAERARKGSDAPRNVRRREARAVAREAAPDVIADERKTA